MPMTNTDDKFFASGPTLAGLLALLALSGCGWMTGDDNGYFRDRSTDYRRAHVEPGLKLPEHLSDEALEDIYIIPETEEQVRLTGEFEMPRPTPLVAKETEELVRINRLGNEQWMLVSTAPGQLWPQVRAFLTHVGWPVGRVEARAGIIETSWLAPREGGAEERFRFRIEQGVQRNTSELHVLQMTKGPDTDAEEWPKASSDQDREAEMLQAVAEFVANSTETEAAPVSMMAQQEISASGKVNMQEEADGTPYIQLGLPFYRAWASVERALKESDYQIRDRDRSAGKFYISYIGEDQDSGWLDWLFGDEDNLDNIEDIEFLLELAPSEDESSISITIQREDEVPLEIAHAQSLLTLIKGNIR